MSRAWFCHIFLVTMATGETPQLINDLFYIHQIHPSIFPNQGHMGCWRPSQQSTVRGSNTYCRSQDTHCFLTHSQLGAFQSSNRFLFPVCGKKNQKKIYKGRTVQFHREAWPRAQSGTLWWGRDGAFSIYCQRFKPWESQDPSRRRGLCALSKTLSSSQKTKPSVLHQPENSPSA